ncbi:MAG: helix-turn-helix domain-containing protein [Kofleriaceae bacterium]
MGTVRLNGSRIAGVLADPFAVRTSTATESSPHVVHGHALFVGLDRDVMITTATGALSGRVVLLPARTAHAVVSPGRTIGICYDPERSPIEANAPRVLDRRLLDIALPARDHLADPTALTDLATELHCRIGAPPRVLDRRVAAAIDALRTPGIDHRRELARIPISRAHLRALFARDIGTQIPTYARWRRLLDALAAFTGTNATAAAHAAGFADLPHFSRTCRQMLGYSPTTLRA